MFQEFLRTIIAAAIMIAVLWVIVPDRIVLVVKGDVVIDQRGGMGKTR
jgi:hypothetical protein